MSKFYQIFSKYKIILMIFFDLILFCCFFAFVIHDLNTGVFASSSLLEEVGSELAVDELDKFSGCISDVVRLMVDGLPESSETFEMTSCRLYNWTQNYEFSNGSQSFLLNYTFYQCGNSTEQRELFKNLYTFDGSGYKIYANTLNVTYVDDSGNIKRAVVVPNRYTVTVSSASTKFDLGTGYWYDRSRPDIHFQLSKIYYNVSTGEHFKTILDGDTLGTSTTSSKKYKYPFLSSGTLFDDVVSGGYLYVFNGSTFKAQPTVNFCFNSVYTNVENENNKDSGNINGSYYYNTYLKQGNTYNKNDVENIINNMNSFVTENTPVITGGGVWESPDFPSISVTAALNPSIVTTNTETLPTNLVSCGTGFLNWSVNLINTIPHLLSIISILGVMWYVFHIFLK